LLRSEQVNFVFHVIPSGRSWHFNGTSSDIQPDVIESSERSGDKSVFIPVAHAVECPQGSIASVVSVESAEARPNVRMHGRTSIHGISEGFGILPERKTARLEWRNGVSISDGASVNDMVQSGPDIIERISHDDGEIIVRNRLKQSEFVDLVSRLRVILNDNLVRIIRFGLESFDQNMQIVDVFLRPCDLKASAFKRVRHSVFPGSDGSS
jgi:hypothetical protein